MFLHFNAVVANMVEKALDERVAAFNVGSNWEDGFVIYATMLMTHVDDSLMSDTSVNGLCVDLTGCVNDLAKYFEKIIQDKSS